MIIQINKRLLPWRPNVPSDVVHGGNRNSGSLPGDSNSRVVSCSKPLQALKTELAHVPRRATGFGIVSSPSGLFRSTQRPVRGKDTVFHYGDSADLGSGGQRKEGTNKRRARHDDQPGPLAVRFYLGSEQFIC